MQTKSQLNWEDRRDYHIYIAGPDFPHIDTKPIEDVHIALDEQNFSPHRPIKENGLFTGEETEEEKLAIYEKDIQLLQKCSLLVAVLINDDPGTYVEIGWMAKSGKPTILYDPDYKAENLFLIKTVNQVCHTLDEVVDAVFEYFGEDGDEIK
ncbi:nucleoside 2-deoxyribosyltransferase [Oceanobacillus halotolerans]|uniref:nucleoside 2-deoxyribosyltransferase n=1 Tax=Oceanobacillus halotolerans TaxID=2663380 RepID=UPI0013D90C59|nr:nucleoside 2-deoxyribosyltransferase [Oceanobacillus halotolerans]